MKPTISEIARLAGVAKSTVSKALNGHPGVSDAKRSEILALVEELRYEPNASAQALASRRTGTIGLLIPLEYGGSLSGTFWAEIITSIAAYAKLHKYSLNILIPNEENDVRSTVESVIRRRNVDGLIIGAERMDASLAKLLKSEEIPFVLIGRNPKIEHYSVDSDNVGGSRAVVEKLISSGYRKIACLGGPKTYHYSLERIEGYRQALKNNGITWQAVSNSVYSHAEVRLALERLIHKHPNVDAIFVTSGGDFLLDSVDVLGSMGYNLQTFGFASFDSYRFFHYLGIEVWSVRQALEQLGQKSAAILLDQIAGKEIPNISHFLDVELVHHSPKLHIKAPKGAR